MDEDRKNEPGERMRTIILSSDDEGNAQFKPKSEPESQSQSKPKAQSILDQLPRLRSSSQKSVQVDSEDTSLKSDTPVSIAASEKLPNSEQPLQEMEIETITQSGMPRGERFLRALWTTASVFSMILNIVLIIVLVIAVWAYRDIKLPEGVDISILNNLLSGLYSNFEKMDRATIETVIPVDAQIPLDITVPVQTRTQITLSETVNIPNAQVVINTGGLNINSTARVTLPAGTPLMVDLNFNLPVRDTIPIHLEVPVSIPMANTELHEPFVGLQDVVRPLYCLVDPNATGLDTQLICQ
jgi:hypothetical protein